MQRDCPSRPAPLPSLCPRLPPLLVLLLVAALFVCAYSVAAQQRRAAPAAAANTTDSSATERDRLAPPAAVTCDRNRLTLYSGRVTFYRRTPTRTTLTIRTDWDTTERVHLRHARQRSPQRFFLFAGEQFTNADWRRIERMELTERRERRTGTLRAGTRANVWVCDDGRNPVVDWQQAMEQ